MSESYPTRAAHLVGPACIGAAIWCAAGIVSVESLAPGAARVLAPAPWWVLVAGVLAGACVPGWRRRPSTALPALLATVPWWPLPLPAIALVWTGSMAWLPILASLVAAAGMPVLQACARVLRAHEPRRASALAAVLTFMIGGATLWSLDPRLPGGDEPHYLVITQSLWLDGDLRIENNHTQRDYAAYFSGTLAPDYINRGQDREIYSIHAPGVSALVLPGFVLFGLRGAQLTILLCLVVTSVLVWRLSWIATGEATSAWFAWASVMGAATTVLLGVMVFPDSPAALGVTAGVWLLVCLAVRPADVHARHLVVVSAALAALPWLHTRFAILAAGLGLAILVAGALDATRPTPARMKRLLTFLAVPLLSAVGWFASFWLIYGTVDPRAPYRGAESIREWIWGAVAGLFADQQFGLLVFAPVLAVALLGAGRAGSRALRATSVAVMALLTGYTLAVSSYHMWWAGRPALPARFLTAAVPLLALPLALAWSRAGRAARSIYLALLAISWLITALVVTHDHGLFAFNDRDGQAAWLEWLSPVVNLPRAWPSFFWRTEGAFLTHALVWLLVPAAGAWLIHLAARRRDDGTAHSALVAGWVLTSVMVIAACGWRLNGVTGLDAARSQLAVHAADRTWTIGNARGLHIRSDERRLFGHPVNEVLAVGPVPAGEYALQIDGAVTRDTVLAARIGRSREPFMTWTLTPGTTPALALPLPAGAATLSIEAGTREDPAAVIATLTPRGTAAARGAVARTFARAADASVYFLDDAVFVEPTGFWVRGGRQAEVVWSGGPSVAGRQRQLHVRNGGAANDVTITAGGWTERIPLDAGQARVVTLPAADTTGSWRVAIRSASGFRPSATGGGNDDRFLGVWVELSGR